MKYFYKINGLPKEKEFNQMPFGRKIEHFRAIDAFKAGAKSVHISQKRRSTAAAIKEFKDLYKPTEYFYSEHIGPDYRDDSIQIWYKS